MKDDEIIEQFIGQEVEVKKKRVRKPYVTNKQLLAELKIYVETGKFTKNFGQYILLMANNISSKPNFAGYTWRDEMVLESVMTTLMYVKNFNPEKSQNPFAYISQIIFNSFRCYLNKEKKIANTKKAMFDEQVINSNCNDDDNEHWHLKKNNNVEIERKLNYLTHIELDNSFGKDEWKLTINNPKTKHKVEICYETKEEALISAIDWETKYNIKYPQEEIV